MQNYRRYAVITTHNRPAELARCVEAIGPQVDLIIIIDNASDPPAISPISDYHHLCIIVDPEQPPNLSRLWNVGLNEAQRLAELLDDVKTWDVCILNDDAVVPSGWAQAICQAMDEHKVILGASEGHFNYLHTPLVRHDPDGNIVLRECPWAFIVRGESGLRSDETLRWWWFDTDFMWRARAEGGTVVIPGYPTQNTLANSSTVGALAEQAGRDGETFVSKWGHRPW